VFTVSTLPHAVEYIVAPVHKIVASVVVIAACSFVFHFGRSIPEIEFLQVSPNEEVEGVQFRT
jgi:hypothetical protein